MINIYLVFGYYYCKHSKSPATQGFAFFMVVGACMVVADVNWFSAAQILPSANKFLAQTISPVVYL